MKFEWQFLLPIINKLTIYIIEYYIHVGTMHLILLLSMFDCGGDDGGGELKIPQTIANNTFLIVVIKIDDDRRSAAVVVTAHNNHPHIDLFYCLFHKIYLFGSLIIIDCIPATPSHLVDIDDGPVLAP